MANFALDELQEDLDVGGKTAGNVTTTEQDGTQQAKGNATCWDDLTNSLIGRRLFSNTGTIDYDYDENAVEFSGGGDINTINDRIGFNLQKPHAAKTDSVTHFHIHWEQPDAIDREFTVRYRIQCNGQAKTDTWITSTVSTNANNVFTYVSGTLNQITELVTIDWSSCPLSSTVQIQMTRSDSDSTEILATFADTHVEYDMLGSREEFTK